MARSQETFSKKEKEKKRRKKKQDKLLKREERKDKGSGSLDDMIAYVDENGQITDTPPDPTKKRKEVSAESIELGVPKREGEEEVGERTGKIDYFDHSKGYGFIKEIGSGESFFVHINGMEEDGLDIGDKVVFELEQGMKGLNAVGVKKAWSQE